MIIKNTMSLCLSRFSIIYKVVVCVLILTLLFTVLAYSAILPTLKDMIFEIKELHPLRATGAYIVSIIKGVDIVNGDSVADKNSFENLQNIYIQIIETIRDNMDVVAISFVFLIVCLLLFSMTLHSIRYNISSIINTFMSTNGDYGFASNIVGNLRPSVKYAFFDMLFSFVYEALGILVAIGVGLLLSKLNLLLGLTMTSLLILISFASKKALCIAWLPIILVKQENTIGAFSHAMKLSPKLFKDSFGAYFAIYLCELTIMSIVGLVTFGFGIFIVFALFMCLTQTYDLVAYYHFDNKKYYTDEQTVVDPSKRYRDAIIENPLNIEEK